MSETRSLFAGLVWQAGLFALFLTMLIGGGSVWVVNRALEAAARADIQIESQFMKWDDQARTRYEASVRAAYEHPDWPDRVYVFADAKGNRVNGGNARQWPRGQELSPGWIQFSGVDIGKRGGRYIGLVRALITEENATRTPATIGASPPARKSYLLVGRRIDATDALVGVLWPGIAIIVLLSLALTWVYVGWRRRSIESRIDRTVAALDAFGDNQSNARPPVASPEAPDELDALNVRIGRMMDRIDRLIAGLGRTSEQVAHEVKDELEKVKRDLPPDTHRDLAERLTRTQKLVSDILEMVRLESGADQTAEIVSLGETVRRAIDLYDEAFVDAGVRLEYVGDEHPSVEIVGRASLVVRAIADLLNNALRHTPQGGVVRISLAHEQTSYRLTISDTGGGVCDTDIDRLARMSRAAAVDNTSGSGLRFVRAVMVRHGGSISLANRDDGLVVTLVFPASV